MLNSTILLVAAFAVALSMACARPAEAARLRAQARLPQYCVNQNAESRPLSLPELADLVRGAAEEIGIYDSNFQIFMTSPCSLNQISIWTPVMDLELLRLRLRDLNLEFTRHQASEKWGWHLHDLEPVAQPVNEVLRQMATQLRRTSRVAALDELLAHYRRGFSQALWLRLEDGKTVEQTVYFLVPALRREHEALELAAHVLAGHSGKLISLRQKAGVFASWDFFNLETLELYAKIFRLHLNQMTDHDSLQTAGRELLPYLIYLARTEETAPLPDTKKLLTYLAAMDGFDPFTKILLRSLTGDEATPQDYLRYSELGDYIKSAPGGRGQRPHILLTAEGRTDVSPAIDHIEAWIFASGRPLLRRGLKSCGELLTSI